MKLSGDQIIFTDRDAVWDALIDPAVLAQCLPGADGVSGTLETGFNARIRKKVGFFDFGFQTHLRVAHLVPNEALSLRGTDQSAVHIRLEEAGQGTRVSYEVNINLGRRFGLLAEAAATQLGSSMSATFFSRLETALKSSGAFHARQVA